MKGKKKTKEKLHDERERLMRESTASPMAKQKALTKAITISKFTRHANTTK